MTTIIAILKWILSWIWNNKIAALCLACLLIVSIKLAITATALSTKTRLVVKQAAQISELLIIQKEDQANIAALKAYSDQIAAQKKQVEKVTVYLDGLPQPTTEILNHEEIKRLNHCLFGYFLNRVLPEGCDKSKRTKLP